MRKRLSSEHFLKESPSHSSRRHSRRGKRSKTPSPEFPNTGEIALSKKEIAAQKRKAAKERQAFIQAFSIAASIGAVIAIILFFVKDLKLAIAGGGGIVVLALSYKYPRSALWAFLLYLPFSGTVTYWIGGGNPLFQLAKDGFFYPAMLALFLELKRHQKSLIVPKSLTIPLCCILFSCLLTFVLSNAAQQFSADPQGKPIVLGIWGFKVLLGYFPLITCTYYLLDNKKKFLWFVRTHIVLVIICCFLGFVQYMMLKTGRCAGTDNLVGEDLFKATLDAKCLVGGSLLYSPSQGVIRLPGTFVAPWQWAWFLIGNAFFTFASAFGDPSLRWQFVSFVAMALVFLNAVISGQRIALLIIPVVILGLIFFTGQFAKVKRFIPIAGGIALLSFGAMTFFPEIIQQRIDSAIDRWNAAPPTEFIAHQFEFTSKGQEGIWGNGLGRGTNSGRTFGKTKLIEIYYAKLLYEIGPLGVIAFLIFVTAITVSTFKAYRSVKDKNLRSYGSTFWCFILFISYQTYYYPLDVDPVNIYYWVLAGAILRLPEIDREERDKVREFAEGEESPPKKRKRKRRIGFSSSVNV
ncbi:MAG: hormogonium polysaccharide biosynthesis protein HpsL [Geitlerinemataceae cyanobacterium]